MKKIIVVLAFTFLLSFSVFAQEEKNDCPSIGIIPPKVAVASGELMKFKISSNKKLEKIKPTYYWRVDKGTIIDGQKTNQIVVSTEGLKDTLVIAEVEIVGLPKGCETKFSEAGIVKSQPSWCSVDEFGELSKEDIWARIDNLFIRISGDSTLQAVILNYGMPNDVSKRENIIREHVESRKYDANRLHIEYVRVEKNIRTVLWLAYPDSDLSKIR